MTNGHGELLFSSLWRRNDYTGHWRTIRIDSDPPLPTPTFAEQMHAGFRDDLRRSIAAADAFWNHDHRPGHVIGYERSLRHEQYRLEDAQYEIDRVREVEAAEEALAALGAPYDRIHQLHSCDVDGNCTACIFDDSEYGRSADLWPCDTIRALLGLDTERTHR